MFNSFGARRRARGAHAAPRCGRLALVPRLFFVTRPVLVCAAAFALCACGGGNGSSVPATASPQPAASPTPPAIAPGASFVSPSAGVSLVADTPLALPYGGDFPAAPTIDVPAQSAPFDANANFTVIA